jgi:hypothetical protein
MGGVVEHEHRNIGLPGVRCRECRGFSSAKRRGGLLLVQEVRAHLVRSQERSDKHRPLQVATEKAR